jgi:hypothetical protein
MSNAKDILEKLKQRREDAEVIKAYWEGVLPGIGNLPESQLQGWMQRFGLATIIAGLDAAVIKRSKLDAKGEKLGVQEAVDYASGAMRETHFEAMPEEERRAYVDKMLAISAKRSEAGKKGRAKQLAEGAKTCREFAQVCPDLPDVARPLPSGNGFGFDVGSGSGPALASAGASGDAVALGGGSAAEKRAVTPLGKTKTETAKPETNPAAVSSSLANRKTVQTEKPKTKTISTAAGRRTPPPGFNSWSNAERLEWQDCTCGATPHASPSGVWFWHADGCPMKVKAKAAVAGYECMDCGSNDPDHRCISV